eukprot:6180499-Pleurochrysis_carterae.AAC.5
MLLLPVCAAYTRPRAAVRGPIFSPASLADLCQLRRARRAPRQDLVAHDVDGGGARQDGNVGRRQGRGAAQVGAMLLAIEA